MTSNSFNAAAPIDRTEPSWVVLDSDGPTTYDVKFFQNWMDRLEKKLKSSLPNLHQQVSFLSACSTVTSVNESKTNTQKLVDQLSKEKPVNQDSLDQAKALLGTQIKALTAAIDLCQQISRSVLKLEDIQMFLADDFDDGDFVTYVILKQAGPQKLADWCARGDTETGQLVKFLSKELDLQRQFLHYGGARKGEYGTAVDIYKKITSTMQDKNTNPVLQKLAMAVALELASPLLRFHSKTEFINPLKRYVHYEQAFLFGELDPVFENFTVWEMRGVVNCDATDEELGWGRQSLMNFRPEIVTMDDPQWRYCYVIHTDVYYQNPEWYKQPPSYDQILAGGGKCGPRAWYGRFICKAFGIPTWGVQQPGHAAMTRWTSKGWTTCLGGGFWRSYWEGRGGLDFQLETQARQVVGNDADYLKKVMRLEWAGFLLNEDTQSVLKDCLPNASSPWSALGLMQRKCIVRDAPSLLPRSPTPSLGHSNKLQALLDMPNTREDVRKELTYNGDTVIIIPAGSPSEPKRESKKASWPKSFLGGKQLILGGKSTVVYTLGPDVVSESSAAQKYHLTFRLCTVHRRDEPLSVTISSEHKDRSCTKDAVVSVDVPYTMGMWQETKPVLIKLGGKDLILSKITVYRPTEHYAISIKDMKLTPA